MRRPHTSLPFPRQFIAVARFQRARVQLVRIKRVATFVLLFGLMMALTACQPSPKLHVLNYLIAQQMGAYEAPDPAAPRGSLAGLVTDESGQPLPGATVVVAERRGTPHTAVSDAHGRYLIAELPPGRYAPAAVAPGFNESVAADARGRPLFVQVNADEIADAPQLTLLPRTPVLLPDDLAAAVKLTQTNTYSATSSFPLSAAADVLSYQFERDGVVIDTLRVYLPADHNDDTPLPLLLFVYPGHVDGWEDVSVAFADQGYGLVAISPVEAWGVDIDQHALDARIALELARSGALTSQFGEGRIDEGPAVALGGSFSSAVLHRLLLDEGNAFGGWVTVGGIANAFTGTEAFHAGELELPPRYEYVIPALGQPNLHPLNFLRYSPVYTAGQLPPTSIIHTAADHISPIEQAYELAAALDREGVPVETFYYDDVSHYLQIGDDMTVEGEEMFERILDFIGRAARGE